MGSFSFTATAECWRCGGYLSSSDEDCDNCDEYPLRRWRFEHLSDDDVQTVWAINPIRAWAELHNQDVDDVLSWQLRHRGMSLHYRQMGYDVTDLEELRQPSLP